MNDRSELHEFEHPKSKMIKESEYNYHFSFGDVGGKSSALLLKSNPLSRAFLAAYTHSDGWADLGAVWAQSDAPLYSNGVWCFQSSNNDLTFSVDGLNFWHTTNVEALLNKQYAPSLVGFEVEDGKWSCTTLYTITGIGVSGRYISTISSMDSGETWQEDGGEKDAPSLSQFTFEIVGKQFIAMSYAIYQIDGDDEYIPVYKFDKHAHIKKVIQGETSIEIIFDESDEYAQTNDGFNYTIHKFNDNVLEVVTRVYAENCLWLDVTPIDGRAKYFSKLADGVITKYTTNLPKGSSYILEQVSANGDLCVLKELNHEFLCLAKIDNETKTIELI